MKTRTQLLEETLDAANDIILHFQGIFCDDGEVRKKLVHYSLKKAALAAAKEEPKFYAIYSPLIKEVIGVCAEKGKEHALQEDPHCELRGLTEYEFDTFDEDHGWDKWEELVVMRNQEKKKEEPPAFVEIRLYDQGERKQPDTVTLPTNKQINDAADQCLREQYPTQDTVTLPRELVEKLTEHPFWELALFNNNLGEEFKQLTAALQQPTKPV